LTLNNDTFVLIELQSVNPGQLDAIEEADRESMVSSLKSDLGGSDFTSYIVNLRENSDINAPLLDEPTF
ncbi:MAG: hypothetical protein MI746_08360, partial [Pseudomonadales bacterium]|nr:hypothetical protein [Pseudomonadales bacterium]